jgi:ureidoglycolate lyase
VSVLLTLEPLTREAFAPYGDVIEVSGEPDKLINQGMCGRFHDLAKLDFGSGRAGISLFDAQARHFPYSLDMMERHPEGSQAFIPLSGVPMIISVAKDNSGKPGQPRAFLSEPHQSINIHRNTWHGVLAPVEREGQYIVIDRIGDTPNLEEYYFQDSYIVNV